MKIKQLLILSAAALSLAACGEHTHSFGDAWKSDDTSHWHECECGEKSGKADHLDTNTDGKCDVCNHDMEVPSPTGTQVTQAEWEVAFGLEKPYYIADNYKAIMRLIMEDETLYPSLYSALQVDGLKAKLTNKEVCTHEEEQFYVKVNNVYNAYLYGQKSEKKWDLFENAPNPARNFANFLEPIFGTYSSFTYNQIDSTYNCVSLDYDGTILTNVNIKFIDKKIVSCSYDSLWGIGEGRSIPFHWTFEITYGGQTVTLPDIPQPSVNEVTSSEWEAALGLEKPFLFADNHKFNTLVKMNGVDLAENNFYVDGNKLKYERVKVPDGETLGSESYYSFENSKYIAYQFTGGKWSTQETSYTPMHGIIQTTLAPFVNPDIFTYDETSKSYKCETTTVDGFDATFTNLEIKFVDKKITEIIFNIGSYDYIYTLTYGGQTVILPEVEQGGITLEGNTFVCTSIIEFEEIKDIETTEGMTLGDMLEGYIGSTIAFENNAFTWNIDKISQIATGSFVQNEDSAYLIHEATNGYETPEELRVQRPIEFIKDSIIFESGYFLPSGDSGIVHLVFDLQVAE